jgi:hypothetical protein
MNVTQDLIQKTILRYSRQKLGATLHPLLKDDAQMMGVEVYLTLIRQFSNRKLAWPAAMYFGRSLLGSVKLTTAARLIPEIDFRGAPSVGAAKGTVNDLVRSAKKRLGGDKQQAALLVAAVFRAVAKKTGDEDTAFPLAKRIEAIGETTETQPTNSAKGILMRFMSDPENKAEGESVGRTILRDFIGSEYEAACAFCVYLLQQVNFHSAARRIPGVPEDREARGDFDALSDLALDVGSLIDNGSMQAIAVCTSALKTVAATGVSLKPVIQILVSIGMEEAESIVRLQSQ